MRGSLERTNTRQNGFERNRNAMFVNDGVLLVLMKQVTLEIVRLANIVPGIFRKALQDIEFKGTIIHTTCREYILLIPFSVRLLKKYILIRFSYVSGPLDAAGYTIPAGWGVMVCPPAVHLNPEIYEDPLAFNPWRWQVCALLDLFVQNRKLFLGFWESRKLNQKDPVVTLLVSVFHDFV